MNPQQSNISAFFKRKGEAVSEKIQQPKSKLKTEALRIIEESSEDEKIVSVNLIPKTPR
jgi:hypothetical protein